MHYQGYCINVILLENSLGIPGSVHLNTDDSYTIFIDAKLNNEKQQEVFWHESHHITNGDFHTLGNINAIESNAHNL